jgi:hypothetical protein
VRSRRRLRGDPLADVAGLHRDAGLSIFELSRVMGASVKTIDKHYGHLARDSEAAIRARLEARAADAAPQAEDA